MGFVVFTAACSDDNDSDATTTTTETNVSSESTNNSDTAIPEWVFTIETPDGEKQFTSNDVAALEIVTIEVTTTKNDETTTRTYTGVKLADILAAVGVSEYSSITVVAADEVTAEYSQELAMADDTILAWEQDGEAIVTEPPLRMVPKQGENNQSVKSVVKVIINQ